MGKFLYNALDLPDINSVWTNKETHPHASIHAGNGGEYYDCDYFLYVSETPWEQGDYSWEWKCGACKAYGVKDGEWELNSDITSGMFQTISSYNLPVWTNTDILNEDGTLYLAASDPVPVLTRSPAAMALGWLAGMAVRRMRGQKTLVGYNYNDVGPLPDIYTVYTPEIQETHPYARMFYNGSRAHLYVSSTPLLFEPGTDTMTSGGFYNPDTSGSYYSYLLILADGAWEQYTPVTGYENEQESAVFWSAWPLLWSNYDITTQDGTVYLAASEPVPVYE